jgi:hypothetical protein
LHASNSLWRIQTWQEYRRLIAKGELSTDYRG